MIDYQLAKLVSQVQRILSRTLTSHPLEITADEACVMLDLYPFRMFRQSGDIGVDLAARYGVTIPASGEQPSRLRLIWQERAELVLTQLLQRKLVAGDASEAVINPYERPVYLKNRVKLRARGVSRFVDEYLPNAGIILSLPQHPAELVDESGLLEYTVRHGFGLERAALEVLVEQGVIERSEGYYDLAPAHRLFTDPHQLKLNLA